MQIPYAKHKLLEKLISKKKLSDKEYKILLSNLEKGTVYEFNKVAQEITLERFGNNIYIRGLIEISNYCHNDCFYCGIRRSNTKVKRYKLSKKQILECCRYAYELDFRTIVLQGGENDTKSVQTITDIIKSIRQEFPDLAITLSLGEFSKQTYQDFYNAGANRYLLRHETFNAEHYKKLHPIEMSRDNRIQCLYNLKDIGFQTGSGIMVGSPYQTIDNIVEDVLFIQELRPEMIGLGPFLSHKDTPFANFPNGQLNMTLMLLSIFRIMFPDALIPSTTSLNTLNKEGRRLGILAGANVLMPNLSPQANRKDYSLYDNKSSFGLESAEHKIELNNYLKSFGYKISNSRGDYRKLS